MNWVGGSRNRLMVKDDAKKQRDFFEKRKMQQKLKKIGIALPVSPRGPTSDSMDLVTLFMVNQIAEKKADKDAPKVAVFSNSKGISKHKRSEALVLPMSPCSPSQLSLVENSDQGPKKRKHVIPQRFKRRQLSPVLESAFSDNSASDYLPHSTDRFSPLSSSSSASSSQGGIVPLHLNQEQRCQMGIQPPHHCSSQTQDSSGPEKTMLFSKPSGTTDNIPWSRGSNACQMQTPTAAPALFGNPHPENTEARDHPKHAASISFNQTKDNVLTLDFAQNQPDNEEQFKEDEEYTTSHLKCVKSKVHLRDEIPVKPSSSQTVRDTQRNGKELPSCTALNFSYPAHNGGTVRDSSYLSQASDDNEEYLQPCLQTASYMDQTCCANTLTPAQGSYGNPKQRPLTPYIVNTMNFRDAQKAASSDKACGANTLQIGGSSGYFPSPPALAQTQCKCKKTPHEMHDMGTQTTHVPIVEMCDASVQCSLVNKAPRLRSYLPPVDASVPHLATGRQTCCTDAASEPSGHAASDRNSGKEVRHSNWSEEHQNKHADNNCDGIMLLQGSLNLCEDALICGTGKQCEEGKDEGQDKVKEVTSGTRVNTVSQDAEAPQETADLLLLLKWKKEE